MPDPKFGTFNDLVAIAQTPLQPIVMRLRAIILDVHPDSCEVVRIGDHAATYGVGPRKMIDGYAYIQPQASWVNLGFYKGADLPDPERVIEGTGAKMRHVKIRSMDEAERPAVRALIKAALDERRRALGG